MSDKREGNLEAPTRHALDWKSEEFYDRDSLNAEMERVFDICHGCRRCLSLCQSFPTLFDLIDDSETMEVDGVDKADYKKWSTNVTSVICVTWPSALMYHRTNSTSISRI